MKYTFDNTIRLIISLAIIVVLILLVRHLSGVLFPFLIGWLLAYLIHPFVNFIQTKMRVKSRGLAVFIALFVIAALLTALVFILVPMISNEVGRAAQLIQQYTPSEDNFILVYVNEIISQLNISDLLNSNMIQSAAEKLLPQLWSLISSTWQMIIGLFVVVIIFLYVIFILLDYQKINDGFRSLIPPKHKELIEQILDDLEKGMNAYFRGQALVALCVGVLFAIGFKLIGLPMGITIGLFIGVLNLVPYLQTVGVVPVLLLAWIESAQGGTSFWVMVGLCFVVFILIQAFQDLFLVPKIMGKAMGLRPAVILLSLSIWGALLGITGMIIALPLTTLMISYYKRYVIKDKG